MLILMQSPFYVSIIHSADFILVSTSPATAFLSDGRQPEVDFLHLHHWVVVLLKPLGKSSL